MKIKMNLRQKILIRLTILLITIHFNGLRIADAKKQPTLEMLAEAKHDDGGGFEAITQLHNQMDDDRSGSVDLEESSEFVREELNVQEKERVSWRQSNFHPDNDGFITVDDLWSRWITAKERNWTTDDAILWLTQGVELPQYADSFVKNAVDGRTLPRLAVQNTSFMMHVLGINNAVHRQKIQLKAMDVVLFGYRLNSSNYVKDVILLILLVFFISLYAFSRYQRTNAQQHTKELMKQMDNLRGIERNFIDLRSKHETEEKIQEELRQQISVQEENKNDELKNLRWKLKEAEHQLISGASPLALKPLLRKTCKLELKRNEMQRLESQRELKEAMEVVDKLRRKGVSVTSTFRNVIGMGDAEDTAKMVMNIKQKMESTASTQEECMTRWQQIEVLCGFHILPHGPSNNGLSGVPLASPRSMLDVDSASTIVTASNHPSSSALAKRMDSSDMVSIRSGASSHAELRPKFNLPDTPEEGVGGGGGSGLRFRGAPTFPPSSARVGTSSGSSGSGARLLEDIGKHDSQESSASSGQSHHVSHPHPHQFVHTHNNKNNNNNNNILHKSEISPFLPQVPIQSSQPSTGGLLSSTTTSGVSQQSSAASLVAPHPSASSSSAPVPIPSLNVPIPQSSASSITLLSPVATSPSSPTPPTAIKTKKSFLSFKKSKK